MARPSGRLTRDRTLIALDRFQPGEQGWATPYGVFRIPTHGVGPTVWATHFIPAGSAGVFQVDGEDSGQIRFHIKPDKDTPGN